MAEEVAEVVEGVETGVPRAETGTAVDKAAPQEVLEKEGEVDTKELIKGYLDFIAVTESWAQWRKNTEVTFENRGDVLPDLNQETRALVSLNKEIMRADDPEIEIEIGAMDPAEARKQLIKKMMREGVRVKNPLTLEKVQQYGTDEEVLRILRMSVHDIGNQLMLLSNYGEFLLNDLESLKKAGMEKEAVSLVNESLQLTASYGEEWLAVLKGEVIFSEQKASLLAKLAQKFLKKSLHSYKSVVGQNNNLVLEYDLAVGDSIEARVPINLSRFRALLDNLANNAEKGFAARKLKGMQKDGSLVEMMERARDFMDDSPRRLEVKVTFGEEEEGMVRYWVMKVEDNGIGIPEEIIARGKFTEGVTDWQESGVLGTGNGMATLESGLPRGSRVIPKNHYDTQGKLLGAAPEIWIPTV